MSCLNTNQRLLAQLQVKIRRMQTPALLKLAPHVGLSPAQTILLKELPVTQQRMILAAKAREHLLRCIEVRAAAARRFAYLVRCHTGARLCVDDARRLLMAIALSRDRHRSLRDALLTVVTNSPAVTSKRTLVDMYVDLHLLRGRFPANDWRFVHAIIKNRKGYLPSGISLDRMQAVYKQANAIATSLTGKDLASFVSTGASKLVKNKILALVETMGNEALAQLPCVGKLRQLSVKDAQELNAFFKEFLQCLVQMRSMLQKLLEQHCSPSATDGACAPLQEQAERFDAMLQSVRPILAELAAVNMSIADDLDKLLPPPLAPELKKLLGR